MKSKFNEFLIRYGERILINLMKTFIFLCCFISFAFGSKKAFSQNAKIEIKHDSELSVEEVFELIKQQTDYTFIYRSDLFSEVPKVTLKKGTIKAKALLEKSLSYGNFTYSFTKNGAILLESRKESSSLRQDFQQMVSGIVTDDQGYPLPGATVSLKGNPTSGTQTDFNGKYQLEVTNTEAILVFRYLGFKTLEAKLEGKTTLDVTLIEDAQSLDEIVVVGYGTQKKSDVTGAISTVKSEDLAQVVTTSPVDALQDGAIVDYDTADELNDILDEEKTSKFSSLIDGHNFYEIKEFAKNKHYSIVAIIYASFYLLIHTYTGKNKILLAALIADRGKAENKGLIGCLLGGTYLPLVINEQHTTHNLIEEAFSTLLEGIENVIYNHCLLDMKGPQLRTSCDVYVNYITIDKVLNIDEARKHVEEHQPDEGIYYALNCQVIEYTNSIYINWRYNHSLFNKHLIEDIVECHKSIVSRIVENKGSTILDTINSLKLEGSFIP